MENYSGWLQMKNGGGFSRRMTVVSFRWRTAALGYRRRTTVVEFKYRTAVGFTGRMTVVSCTRRTTVLGFKWRTLVLSGFLQVNNYSSGLQMENHGGFRRRTTVVSLRWRTTARAKGHKQRTTVIGFKWRKLGKESKWLASNGKQWWTLHVKRQW